MTTPTVTSEIERLTDRRHRCRLKICSNIAAWRMRYFVNGGHAVDVFWCDEHTPEAGH